jgi:hypothetical protein
MTTAAARGDGPPAAHVRLVRAAADLIEQAGIPGLALYPEQDELVTQVPAAAVRAGDDFYGRCWGGHGSGGVLVGGCLTPTGSTGNRMRDGQAAVA